MNNKTMNLFTIILDFKEGTYIRQIESDTPLNAVIRWASNLRCEEIYGLDPTWKKSILDELKDKDNIPTPLENILNVWCTTFTIKGSLGLINIVKTKKE